MALPIITSLTPADLDAVILLERQVFTDPWTRRMYLADLTTNEMATYLAVRPAGEVAAPTLAAAAGWQADDWRQMADAHSAGGNEVSPSILAWGGFWLMVDEAHIATIATHPDWRGCGLGQWLMLALLDTAHARGATIATLEVRAQNQPAIKLYQKLGFQIVGRRHAYYRDGEDGLIMTTPQLDEPGLEKRLLDARQDALEKLERCFTTNV